MSPDLKRKYESKIGEFETCTFGIGTDVRDIGDKSLVRETVTGRSGVIKGTLSPEVENPTMESIVEVVTPTKETATMTSVYETSVE